MYVFGIYIAYICYMVYILHLGRGIKKSDIFIGIAFSFASWLLVIIFAAYYINKRITKK